MSEKDPRRRAFVACAACLIATVAALLLLGGGGDRERAGRPGGAAAPGRVADHPTAAGAATAAAEDEPAAATDDPAAHAKDGRAAADPPAVLPAGQALSRADVQTLQAGPRTAPAPVRAIARRFVETYLVYELGAPPPALHDRIMALTGGRLRAALQHEPPRRPLGTRLERWRLVTLDGVCDRRDPAAASRCSIAYVVRRGERFVPHALTLEKEGGRWLATDLIG